MIHEYIKNQEKEDDRLDQLGLWRRAATDQVADAMRGRVSDPFPAALSGSQPKAPALPGDGYRPKLDADGWGR